MCDGFYSLINILPEEKLGIVILQNVFHPKSDDIFIAEFNESIPFMFSR